MCACYGSYCTWCGMSSGNMTNNQRKSYAHFKPCTVLHIAVDHFLPFNTVLSVNKKYSLAMIVTEDLDDIIKWKHFPRYWTFVRGIHRSPKKNYIVSTNDDLPIDAPCLHQTLLFRTKHYGDGQSWGCWFATPSRSLWRHRNVLFATTTFDDDMVHQWVGRHWWKQYSFSALLRHKSWCNAHCYFSIRKRTDCIELSEVSNFFVALVTKTFNSVLSLFVIARIKNRHATGFFKAPEAVGNLHRCRDSYPGIWRARNRNILYIF